MKINAALFNRRDVGVVIGPWIGFKGGSHERVHLFFDAHAQHIPTLGFGSGLAVVLWVRGRRLVRFARNWGGAYR